MKLPSKKTLLWLCTLALLVDLFSVATLTVLPWNATDGITWQSDGSFFGYVATSVENPAATEGVRKGDRFDLRDLIAANGYSSEIAGRPVRYTLERHGHKVEAVVTPVKVSMWWPFIVRAIAVCWLLGFAVLIIVRARPTVENRLLVLFLICMALESQLSRMAMPNLWATWFQVDILGAAAFIFANVLLVLYANCFGRPLSTLRRWFFWLIVAVLGATEVLGCVAGWPGINLLPWMSTLLYGTIGTTFPIALSLVALALAIQAAPKSERQRIGWVFAGFAFFTVALAVGELDAGLGWLRMVQELGYAAIPLALTYAALARRMFDIGFILNRAAVFAVVSALIVAAFVVLEWALAKWFEDASHTTSLALNAALALGIGFSMRFIHQHVDRFIDTVFFRKRHENETALRRFGREAGFISDRDTLLERTRDEVLARTEASSASILFAEELPTDDPAALALQAWHEPLDLNGYQTAIEGDYAFPMVAHGKLVGALVCGEKRNAEHYAPDEIEALSTMAHGVGLAVSDLDRKAEAPSVASALVTITSALATITSRLDDLSAGQIALIDSKANGIQR